MSTVFKKELNEIRKSIEQILVAVEKIETSERFKKSVRELGLSKRAVNCLVRRNIGRLDQLLELSRQDLLSIRNLGISTLDEICGRIRELGFDVWR